MRREDFNEGSEKTEFIYRQSQVDKNTYLILQYQADKGAYEPVGDYVLLDTDEDPELTEKKVMNLITLINGKGKGKLLDLRNLTDGRTLFYPIPDSPDAKEHKLVFRKHDDAGVSTENAVITIKKGVIDDYESID